MARKVKRESHGKEAQPTSLEASPSQSEAKRPANLVLTVLPLIAAMFTAGSVLLHALGAITHRTFLSKMGVPSDLFPKDVAWTLLNGYYALLDRWNLLFKTVIDAPLSFLGYSFGMSAAIILFVLVLRWNPQGWEKIEHWPQSVKVALRSCHLRWP